MQTVLRILEAILYSLPIIFTILVIMEVTQ